MTKNSTDKGPVKKNETMKGKKITLGGLVASAMILPVAGQVIDEITKPPTILERIISNVLDGAPWLMLGFLIGMMVNP